MLLGRILFKMNEAHFVQQEGKKETTIKLETINREAAATIKEEVEAPKNQYIPKNIPKAKEAVSENSLPNFKNWKKKYT